MGQDVIAVEADQALEADLALAMRRKMNRLAKAQALAWNSMTREAQLAYLIAVDRMEDKRG